MMEHMMKTHIEEARRLKVNPQNFYRHNRPVLRPGDMSDTEA